MTGLWTHEWSLLRQGCPNLLWKLWRICSLVRNRSKFAGKTIRLIKYCYEDGCSFKEYETVIRQLLYIYFFLLIFLPYVHLLFELWFYKMNTLTPNDDYSGRTAPLTSKLCILYIYSTNIGTEYFKHGIYSPFFLLKNAVCFINLTYLFPVLFTFYIQSVLKLKK